MPWWFWVITHLWTLSNGVLISAFIHDDKYQKCENTLDIISYILCHLFAPLVLIAICVMVIWEEVITRKYRGILNRFERPKNFILNWFKKRKDFKEAEDNEDEWEAERVGIKIK